jgi:DNA-binding IclR family transcriptional regulator
MAEPATPRRGKRRVQSIEVGFRVIDALVNAGTKLPLKQIAADAGMPASKAYLYLASFVDVGMVVQDPVTARYGLGSYAVHLGLAGMRQLDVADVARDPMERLQEATGLSVFLSIWGNLGPVILMKVDGRSDMPLTLRVGSVLSLSESATGQVFVAYQPAAEIEAVLLRLGRKTKKAETGAIGETVRAAGLAFSDSRFVDGFAALAAPVFHATGEVAAAITLLGSRRAIEPAVASRPAERLRATAAEISRALGHASGSAAPSGRWTS